jgi:hypothetical protein
VPQLCKQLCCIAPSCGTFAAVLLFELMETPATGCGGDGDVFIIGAHSDHWGGGLQQPSPELHWGGLQQPSTRHKSLCITICCSWDFEANVMNQLFAVAFAAAAAAAVL